MTIKKAGGKVNITMTRGDSESITVSCYSAQNGVREFMPLGEGDTVTFTVREDAESAVLLQIEADDFPDGKAVIPIDHDDTAFMDFGEYVYDIQLTRSDGTVKTLIQPSSFKLTEEVTY